MKTPTNPMRTRRGNVTLTVTGAVLAAAVGLGGAAAQFANADASNSNLSGRGDPAMGGHRGPGSTGLGPGSSTDGHSGRSDGKGGVGGMGGAGGTGGVGGPGSNDGDSNGGSGSGDDNRDTNDPGLASSSPSRSDGTPSPSGNSTVSRHRTTDGTPFTTALVRAARSSIAETPSVTTLPTTRVEYPTVLTV